LNEARKNLAAVRSSSLRANEGARVISWRRGVVTPASAAPAKRASGLLRSFAASNEARFAISSRGTRRSLEMSAK